MGEHREASSKASLYPVTGPLLGIPSGVTYLKALPFIYIPPGSSRTLLNNPVIFGNPASISRPPQNQWSVGIYLIE